MGVAIIFTPDFMDKEINFWLKEAKKLQDSGLGSLTLDLVCLLSLFLRFASKFLLCFIFSEVFPVFSNSG